MTPPLDHGSISMAAVQVGLASPPLDRHSIMAAIDERWHLPTGSRNWSPHRESSNDRYLQNPARSEYDREC
jgi:hypothetical protein